MMTQAPRRFRPHFPTAGDLESIAEDLVASKARQERHKQSWREHTHRDPDGAAKVRAIVHDIRALLMVGAEVTAVKLDPAWVRCLSEDKAFSSVRILEADFLALAPSHDYDAVVMNPPLDAGVGGQHISHALRFAPRVVSVIRTHDDLHGKGRYEQLWKGARVAGIAFCVNRPRFGKGARADGPQAVVSLRWTSTACGLGVGEYLWWCSRMVDVGDVGGRRATYGVMT